MFTAPSIAAISSRPYCFVCLVLRARDAVRERMCRTGVEAAFGEDRIYDTVMEGVKAFEEQSGAPA